MKKKKALGAVISFSLMAFVLTTSAAHAATTSIPSTDGAMTYKFSYASLASYDTDGNLIKEVNLCPTSTSCNKWYGNGTLFSQIQVDDDGVYLIGQTTTRVQRRNMQENFATTVVKYDTNLNKVWEKTYRVESSNFPLSSKIENDTLYVSVKAGTNMHMGAYGQMCRYISTYSLAIDDNGVMTATKQ